VNPSQESATQVTFPSVVILHGSPGKECLETLRQQVTMISPQADIYRIRAG
jgi:hypothetical protein